MTARTLLLTGCDGFIGRHVARAARESGWRVVGVTRSLQPVAEVDERVLVDLNAAGAEEALVSAMEGATAIVHAAARVQLFGRAAPVIAENLKVTGKVIRAAERAGRPRLVFLSSASVLFERREQRGLMEDAPLPNRCLNGYAESKKLCEGVVSAYDGSSAILRPQAVIGPGDRTLLPPVLHAARKGSWRWMGQRNEAETDPMSVRNLAAYCLRAAERPEARGVFHVSDGESVPIEALFRRVFEAVDLRVTEKRISTPVAKLLAKACEWPLRLCAPRVEPFLTDFAVEVLTRTRTLHRTRTLAQLGPPSVPLEQGVRAAIEALRGSEGVQDG